MIEDFKEKVLFGGGLLLGLLLLSGCQTTAGSYVPPAKPAMVESVDVFVTDFHGRPDVYADIKGRLSSNAAKLTDVQQFRGKGNLLFLEVSELTPRGVESTNRVPHPPFQTRVPVEILGLAPGQTYVLVANGVVTHFTMPGGEEEEEIAGYMASSSSTGMEWMTH